MTRPIAIVAVLVLALTQSANGAPSNGSLVRIAVVEGKGYQHTLPEWQPTADYLERLIPGFTFAFLSYDLKELRPALERGLFDFVLTDSGLFIDLEQDYNVAPVVMRRMLQHREPSARFGALILTRADRRDITELADLRGKSFMAAHEGFGSFYLAWRELHNSGIRPFRDLASVMLENDTADNIVYALRDGKVDAIAIPTGAFERLSEGKRIDPRMFRVLNPRPPADSYGLITSTTLYPEWTLAAMPATPEALTQAVARALLAMKPDDRAARVGGYAGWTTPLSYAPVHALFKDLRLGPYEEKNLLELMREHWWLALIDTLALLALAGAATYVWRANRKLAHEIHRGRRTQEQMQMFASAVDQTADAVMITDPHGTIEYVNPAFTHMTGYTVQEACGQTPRLLRSGEQDAAFYESLWRTILRGEVFREDLINRRKDGTLYWEQKTIMPLRDERGRIAHFVAMGRDITEQRRAEEEAHLRREQLAHTARVNVIGEMAASIAHEISQPLTAILNYAQGSIRRLRTGEIESNRLLAVFEHIVAQSQRAGDAMLTLRRFVARHKPARVRVEINTLVTQVAALAGAETRKRGIGIVLDLSPDLPPAYVDDVQIEQVVLNLLRNGADALASADGSARELKVRTRTTDEGSIEISVSDTGPGLPPRLAAKLFEPFFSTKPDGVGLGLAVSRTIIETHGGRIWVTPNPDRGVTFRFTVPVETHAHER